MLKKYGQSCRMVMAAMLVALSIIVPMRSSFAGSSDIQETINSQITLPGPFAVVDAWMTHIRTRARDDAFLLLSDQQHKKFDDSARIFMNTLRLTQHAIYNHETYQLLTPVTQNLSDQSTLIKIQLLSRDGVETLGILRVLRVNGDQWKIDGITVLSAGRPRDA